ncbi:MAG TPA: DUF952 domain-containing protein [Devosia sp.]|jgi:uncharacterized protein (DUF952 family)|nr:DUF952 domain-containing protein [Devosia sp.]
MSHNPTAPELIYKICSHEAYRVFAKTGVFPGMPVDLQDGYIHLSTADQLGETLRLHFAGQGPVVVFSVRTAELETALRWEPSRGGQLFPHLYGDLPISALGEHATVSVESDASVSLPEWVR